MRGQVRSISRPDYVLIISVIIIKVYFYLQLEYTKQLLKSEQIFKTLGIMSALKVVQRKPGIVHYRLRITLPGFQVIFKHLQNLHKYAPHC